MYLVLSGPGVSEIRLYLPGREPVGIHAEGAAKPEGVCGVSMGIGKPLLERLRIFFEFRTIVNIQTSAHLAEMTVGQC